jgi:RND family efflux transporter MFP subunit
MNRKSITNTIIATVVLIVTAAGIRWILLNNKKQNASKAAIVAQVEPNILVRGSLVTSEPLKQTLSVNGSFIAARQLNFASEISGRVSKVLATEGSKVYIGQTLAIIEGQKLNVDKESAQKAYELAERDQQRFENAFKTGGVTQQQLDQARLAVSNAAARLKDATIRVSDTYVLASINGIVNKRMVEPGSVVSPGTALFELIDISQLRLKVMVTENQIAQIRLGNNAGITLSAFPEKKFNGRVAFIAPKAGNTLGFPVEIELTDDPSHLVKAGMYGTAIFTFTSTAPVTMVPRSAFVGSVSSGEVFLIMPDSTVSLQKVVAGKVIADKIEVLEGLREGQTVVTTGQINLDEGSRIHLVK